MPDKENLKPASFSLEPFVLAVGGRYPEFAGFFDGAILDVGSCGLSAYVLMAQPTPEEVALFESGSELELTAGRVDDVLVMTMRFGGKHGFECETLYTPGFAGNPDLPEVDDGMGYLFTMALLDQRGTCRALRAVGLSTEMSRYIYETVSDIISVPFDERAYRDTCTKVQRHYSLYELRWRAACRYAVNGREACDPEAPASSGDAHVRDATAPVETAGGRRVHMVQMEAESPDSAELASFMEAFYDGMSCTMRMPPFRINGLTGRELSVTLGMMVPGDEEFADLDRALALVLPELMREFPGVNVAFVDEHDGRHPFASPSRR